MKRKPHAHARTFTFNHEQHAHTFTKLKVKNTRIPFSVVLLFLILFFSLFFSFLFEFVTVIELRLCSGLTLFIYLYLSLCMPFYFTNSLLSLFIVLWLPLTLCSTLLLLLRMYACSSFAFISHIPMQIRFDANSIYIHAQTTCFLLSSLGFNFDCCRRRCCCSIIMRYFHEK